jgi:hypothetical protein
MPGYRGGLSGRQEHFAFCVSPGSRLRCSSQQISWIKRMTHSLPAPNARFFVAVAVATVLGLASASAAPTAEVAKRCLHYSYVAYPYKRPGAMPMNGDRQAYFKDCISKDGAVPAPTPPKP